MDEVGGTKNSIQVVRTSILSSLRQVVGVIRRGDDAAVEKAVLQLSHSRRWLAPVALVAGALLMLFQGLKLLFTNWRLTLIQVLPAMWIWIALLDLKVHLLHGKSFHFIRGPLLILFIVIIAAITAAGLYLNAVFVFSISRPGTPDIRSAFTRARTHLTTIMAWGFIIGLALGVAALVSARWGRGAFALSLGVVVAVMMVCYVTVPSRLIGVATVKPSRRDQLTNTAVGGALGAVVCSPPYLLGRIGLLMLGSHLLFIPGLILLIIGLTLQAGATGAVKAVKISAKVMSGQPVGNVPSTGGDQQVDAVADKPQA